MTAAPSPPTVRGDSSTNLAHPGRNACAHTKPGNPGCPDREDGKHRAGNRKAEANRGRKRAVTFSADTRGSEQDGEQHRASLKAGQREARSVPTVQHAVAKGAKRANDRAETRIPRLSFASPFSKARTAGRPRSNTDVRVDHASVDPSGNRSELHVNKRVATDQIPTQQVTDGLSPQVEAAKVPEASTRISPDSMPAGQQVPEASADASSDQITYSHSDLTQRDNQDSDWPNLPLSELGDKGMIPGKVLGSRALGNTGAASNWPLMSMPQTGGASRLPSKLLAMGRGTRGRVVGAQYAPPRPRFANAIMSRSARSALQEESGQFEDAASDYDNVALSHTKDSATEDRVKDGSAQTVGSVTDSAKDESTSASNGVEQIKGSEASAHASPVMRRSALSDTTGPASKKEHYIMNQPALQILPVPRSETTVSLSEEVTPKSPPTPRSPDTEQLDRHLTSATQALNELRESVLARPRSLYEPVIALSQRGTSSEGALRHNSMGTYGTVLSRAATQALRSPLSADTKLSSPYFTPDSSPRVRNWRAEYQRMRRASLVDLDEEDTQDVLNPTSVQGVSSLRNEAVPSDSLFMRRFSSDFETSPESSDEAGPHAQLSSMPDTDGDSPTLGRLNQDPIDSPVTRGRTLKRTVGGLQGQNGQNQLLGDDGEVSGARDTVTNSSIGDTLDQVDEDDNDPLDQDETLVERDSMNGLGGGIGLGLFGMPDEDQPFMGARDLLDGKTDDVEQMGQTYVQQLPSSDAVPEGPAAIKNLKDGAAMSATGPTSSTPAHLVGRDVAVDSPIAGAKADPTTPSVDRADPVLQKIQSRAVSVENPDIGGASADPDTSSLEQSSSNVLQNVQDRDVSFENPAVGEASADPKTPSLGQGASALQLVKGREVRIDGPNFGANASPKSPSLDGAAKPSIPARFLRRGLYERYWNLTQSSAPSSPTFATTSWSNPCPPTTTTGKSWTSALATSESMPSSPQMLNSPTLGTSAPNSPMLTQTPTMASATNSPMVSQTPNMANTSDAFNMPGAFSTPVPTDAQYQSGESQGNGAPESHAYHPGPPVVAATAVGSLVLLGALIWALLMLNKRSKRRRHLREVLEKFGSGGDGKSSLSIESHGRSLDLAEKAVFDGSDTKPSAGGYGASGKLGIDSTAYFNQQSTDQLNVISPWLTYEDSRSGDAADSARISTDLARSGIVTTQLVPQKDVTFTWQHPTLALPPAAARALAVGHYIKKRATLPPKVRVPAVGPAGPAGMSRVMSEGTVRVADHGETSGAEAVSSSSCIDPELESPPGTPRIDGQGVHSDTAPEQSTTGGRSDTESTNADGGRTWLSLVLGKGRKPDMQKPEDRNGSPPSISSAGTPTQTSGPSLGSSDSEGSAEVRFVTAKPSNPSTATANAFSGRDAMAVASRLVNQISLPKRNSTNSIRSTSTYSMQSSESSTDPYMMRSSMRDSARVSFAQASGSGSKRRMPGWHNSLPPCREDSNENMGGKARSSLSPLPKAFLASLGEGTEDSSEDELRQGYEAGEETDTDTGRHLGQSHSAGEFGAPAHSSPLARPGSISSPHISGLSPMATSSKARSADSLSPSVYNSCDTTPSSSTGAVHKRAPRLPPMLVPSITLTLDDDTFGLVERPLSLVSSNDSDRESMPNMRHFAGNPAAPDLRVPQQAGSGSNKGGMSIDVGQQSIRSAVEAAGIERETMYDDLLDDDSEGPHVAPPAGWADRDEDGYGSDSAEGCLELSDFPTLPPWTPMEKSKRAPRAHAGGR